MAKHLRLLLVLLVMLAGTACAGLGAPQRSGGQAGSMSDAPGLRMLDADNGWSYGRILARTSDGARTFKDVTPPGLTGAEQLDQPFFLDAKHAWVFIIEWNHSVLGSSVLERTADGGASWSATVINPALDGELSFVDPLHGWLISGEQVESNTAMKNVLWRTLDGGQTWSQVVSATYQLAIGPNLQQGTCSWLSGIAWTSALHGVSGVDCPVDSVPAVEITDDGGSTWTRVALPALPARPGRALFENVGPIHAFPDGELAAVVTRCAGYDGGDCTPYGELYRSKDHGATWRGGEVFAGGGKLLMPDPDHAWMPTACLENQCDKPVLLTTADGGADWRQWPLRNELGPNMHGSRIYSLVTPSLGFAVATNDFTTQGKVQFFKTTDGGQTFDAFTPVLVGS